MLCVYSFEFYNCTVVTSLCNCIHVVVNNLCNCTVLTIQTDHITHTVGCSNHSFHKYPIQAHRLVGTHTCIQGNTNFLECVCCVVLYYFIAFLHCRCKF